MIFRQVLVQYGVPSLPCSERAPPVSPHQLSTQVGAYPFENISKNDKRPLQGYTMSASLEAAPGDVVSETENATTYIGATAATFEGENTLEGPN